MSLGQELRFAGRMLTRDWWCTILSIAVLALGMGATTSVFSILIAIRSADPPWRDPQSLVHIDLTHRQWGGSTALSASDVLTLVAAAVPARRAASVDPIEVLRSE